MSQAEAEILSVPEKEQIRLALIYIGKMLEKINGNLERLIEVLESTISVEVYRGEI